MLCIVHPVTGLEKLPLAEVLTRHKRHGQRSRYLVFLPRYSVWYFLLGWHLTARPKSGQMRRIALVVKTNEVS